MPTLDLGLCDVSDMDIGLGFNQSFMDSSNFEGSFSQKIFTFIGIVPPPFIFAINITL